MKKIIVNMNMKKILVIIAVIVVIALGITAIFVVSNTIFNGDADDSSTPDTVVSTSNTIKPTTEPTTQPTTAKPTTEPTTQPTTAKPTTQPTTAEPTTEPTTAEPTTKQTDPPVAETTAPTTKPTAIPSSGATPNAFEMKVFELINKYRAEAGADPLEFGYFYYDCARLRAEEGDTCFSHTRPDGTQYLTAFGEYGIDTTDRFTGENIGQFFNNAESAMEAFMNSPAHKENILQNKYDYVAVAVYENEKKPGYYTVIQLFASDIIDWAEYYQQAQ